MKPKNVMLLGFVNRAVEYLDSHFDEQPDPRIAELKNVDLASLRDELADNLDTSLGTMQSTMATLLKAGNEAFDQFVEDSKGKVTIADEFDKLFDVDLDGAKKNKQQQLAKLLSFYNLDNDFDDYEDSGFVNEEPFETNFNGIASQDDDYLQQIVNNINSDNDVNNVLMNVHDLGDTSELDSVFSEIVINEQTINNNDIKTNKVETTKAEETTEVNEVVETAKPAESSEVVEPVEEVVTTETAKPVESKKDSSVTYLNSLISELKEQINKEDSIERVDNRKEVDEENTNKEVYERISKFYPYLTMNFIKTVYRLKGPISLEYPIDKEVIVLHRVLFKDVDNLRKYVEICLNHDYQINADEDKMIVDVFKAFVNTDGKILANIYEIANQGCLLGGNYEGYNVLVNEEDE